jgi:hypothetical protein
MEQELSCELCDQNPTSTPDLKLVRFLDRTVCLDCLPQLAPLMVAQLLMQGEREAETEAQGERRDDPLISEEERRMVEACVEMQMSRDKEVQERAFKSLIQTVHELKRQAFVKGMAAALMLADRPDLIADYPPG